MLKKLEHNVDLAIEIAADRLAGHILHHKNDAKLGELCASALAALIQSAAVYGSILVLAAAFRMFWDSILWTVFFFCCKVLDSWRACSEPISLLSVVLVYFAWVSFCSAAITSKSLADCMHKCCKCYYSFRDHPGRFRHRECRTPADAHICEA